MRLLEYKADYLYHCRLKELSASTLRTYELHINYFINFIGNIDVSLLCQKVVEDYVLHINTSSLAVMSKRSYLREVKMFLYYIDRSEKTNNASYIVMPRKRKKIVHIFTDSEIAHIYSFLNSYRDRLIFALAYDCGLRRIEITRLRISDISIGFFKVLGKGNKERLVPYGSFVNKLFKVYLEKEHCSDCEYLIITRYGEQFTLNGISNFFRKLSVLSGLDVSAHQLRHNFATNFLINQIHNGSSDLFQLQLILGHSDPEVTKYYLHLANEQLIVKGSYSKLDNLML